jgi:sensor c-di-GMP phosphodiesterase-like protein
LGKSIVAEGIEKEEHKELLKSLSCDYGQGYLYSKPLNSSNAEEFLRNHTVSQEDGYQSATTVSQVDTETITNQYAM